MTVRETIAQIRKTVNSVNTDVRLSNRFIYNKLMDVVKLLMKREADTRKIYRSIESFKSISCIKLQPEDLKVCTNLYLPGCRNIMKSVNKIPKTFIGNTGSILLVYNIDKSIQFTQTTPSNYLNVLRREFKSPQKYFWISDDYLYIPDSFIEEVIIYGVFLDLSQTTDDKCFSLLDADSSIPDWLRTDAIRVTVGEIASVTKRISQDESTELNSNKLN